MGLIGVTILAVIGTIVVAVDHIGKRYKDKERAQHRHG